jgi:hypothetical protein
MSEALTVSVEITLRLVQGKKNPLHKSLGNTFITDG